MKRVLLAAGVLCGLAMTASAGDGYGPVHAPPSWSGVYIGGFVGVTRTRDSWESDETTPGSTTAAPFAINGNGLTFGGLVGANMQMGRAIWGVELDLDKTRSDGRITFTGQNVDAVASKTNWNGHARLRFGLDMGHWMPFVAGGLAFADTTVTLTTNGGAPAVESRDLFRTGVSLGVGADMQMSHHWLARVEYIHDRYGSASYGSAQQADSEIFALRTNTLRAAVIYKLN